MMEFDINCTAKAAKMQLSTLRSWLKLGSIQRCGVEPRPSYPRALPLYGVYEVALAYALTRRGVDRQVALAVVQKELARWEAQGAPSQAHVWVLAAKKAPGGCCLDGPFYGETSAEIARAIAILTASGADSVHVFDAEAVIERVRRALEIA